MGAKWSGLDRFNRKAARLPAAIRAAIREALDEASREIVEAQKRAAPRKTGALAKSITRTFGDDSPAYAAFRSASRRLTGSRRRAGDDPDLQVRITAGNSAVRYAHLVEFGTAPHVNDGRFAGTQNPGAPARPFFFPAYRLRRRGIRGRVARKVNKAIKRTARS